MQDKTPQYSHDEPIDGQLKSETEKELRVFLGQAMSESEYETCRANLREFFRILATWRKGEADESSDMET